MSRSVQRKKCSMLLSVWHYSLVLTIPCYTVIILYNNVAVVRCHEKEQKLKTRNFVSGTP